MTVNDYWVFGDKVKSNIFCFSLGLLLVRETNETYLCCIYFLGI